MGAKKKTAQDRMMRIRCTAPHLAAFEAAAQQAGLSLSAWVRFIALREVKRA